MSTRKKLAVSLGILGLTVIMAIVSVIGVIALLDTNFSFGGNISFTAGVDIDATISAATVEGGAVTGAGKMQAITINAENDGSAAMGSWSDVNLSFSTSGAPVVIKFTITNHNPVNALKLIIANTTKPEDYDNAEMTVSIDEEDEGVTEAEISADPDADTDGDEDSREVIVTFKIGTKNQDASINNFAISITLQNA